MNTLHLCHWQGRKHLKNHLSLISEHDSLVIYGLIESSDKLWMLQNLPNIGHPWYLVNKQASPNIDCHEIDYYQWLTLIIDHKNSLAWK